MGEGSLFIGLDAGSSVCKAALFRADGSLVSTAAERTPLTREGGRVEADPERAWSAAVAVLRRVVADAQGKGRVEAMGLTGAMVGAWVIDGAGKTLRPGINWEDSRAGHILERLQAANPRVLSEIFARSGSALQLGCTLPVMAALAEDEPEVLARARAVLGYKDWLRFRLTGSIATDVSEAAVAPGDARSQSRDDDLVALFGLSQHAALLPQALPSAQIAGAITAEAAALTGLPEGLPVVAGAGDVVANVIGCGGMRPGAVTGLLGTTCMIGVCRGEPVFTPADIGLLFSLPERHWFRAMVNVAGTLNLDWVTDLLCADLAHLPDRWERITALAASAPAGSRGVTYLPYLSESGIIAPVVAPSARAGFGGLSPATDRAAMIRAVYEGVACSIADLCDHLDAPADAPVILTGGGGRSAFWCDLIAGLTGRTVTVPDGDEFGARGAALLSMVATGHYPDVVSASAAMSASGRTHHPDPAAAPWQAIRDAYAAARDRTLRPA